MTSLWDALCPYLGIVDALRMTECTHEFKQHMTKRIDMIVKHDKKHSLARLTRVVLDTEDIDMKMLKDFKVRVLARDMDIFLILHKQPAFYTNNDLQDLYMDQCIYFDKDAYQDIDKQIMSMLSVCLESLEKLEHCDRFSCFAFMTRVLAQFIKWIVHNGLQDNPNVGIFTHDTFCFKFRSKIYNYLDRLYMVKDEKKRDELRECISNNKKYIIALVIKQRGIYSVYKNKHMYY